MQERKHELDEGAISPRSPKRTCDESQTPFAPEEDRNDFLEPDNETSHIPEDEPVVAPPKLEIIDVVHEFDFSPRDEVWEPPGFKKTIVTVRIDMGQHFLANVDERLRRDDVQNLNLALLNLAFVAMEDIPQAFASWLANEFGIGVESIHTVPIPCEDVCPVFPPSLTAAPERMVQYFYLKYSTLDSYEPGGVNRIKELVLAEASICEVLMKNPHPNIVKYWGCHVVDHRIRALCLAKYPMTLKERVDTGVPLDTEHCLKGIRDGILHLHSLGLVHNDINPRNIMLDTGDNPIIIDFDSCTYEGERIVKGWTMNWCLEEAKTGERENDFYGLQRLEEYLSQSLIEQETES